MRKLLGVDPGAARSGIAITDSAATMAFPRASLASDDSLVDSIAALVREEHVGTVVVGRPVALSGSETASTKAADDLYEALREVLSEVLVVQWDERLTTVEAQRSLTRAGRRAREYREQIDSAAAVVMLQSYVDGQARD